MSTCHTHPDSYAHVTGLAVAKQSGYVSPGLRPGRMRALRVPCSRRLQHLFHAFGVQIFSRSCQAMQENAQLFLSCVGAGVLGSGAGKGAKTINNPRPQQLANGHSRSCPCSRTKKGPRVCLYSLTASQNPRQLRLSKIVDTIPSVVLWTLKNVKMNESG